MLIDFLIAWIKGENVCCVKRGHKLYPTHTRQQCGDYIVTLYKCQREGCRYDKFVSKELETKVGVQRT